MASLRPGYPNSFLISALFVSLVIKRWKRHAMTLRVPGICGNPDTLTEMIPHGGLQERQGLWKYELNAFRAPEGNDCGGAGKGTAATYNQFHPAFCSPLKNIKIIWLLILETKGALGVSGTHLHEAAETSVSTGDNDHTGSLLSFTT